MSQLVRIVLDLPHIMSTDERNEALILYMPDQIARVACDRNCNKAWGRNSRPEVQCSGDVDDTADLADWELGNAPADPGTYEGDVGKPKSPAEFPQKWCVRECERCAMSMPGKWPESIELPDFSKRVYNIPREAAAQ